jgi:hypothetical protein
MPAEAPRGLGRKVSGGDTQRVLHLRLDPNTAEALARLTADGRPATDAVREAIRGWAGLAEALAAQAAGIARIEAHLAAGATLAGVGAGSAAEPPAAQAEEPEGIQPDDVAWLPDDER